MSVCLKYSHYPSSHFYIASAVITWHKNVVTLLCAFFLFLFFLKKKGFVSLLSMTSVASTSDRYRREK